MTTSTYDAIVIGAGPNGLTAAATLAAAGRQVLVIEGAARIGGGCRTEALTLPGFAHDVCSAIHPMAVVSPAFRELGLDRDVQWVRSPVALAHPLPDGRTATLTRDVTETGVSLGHDAHAWQAMVRPFVDRADDFFSEVLRPIRLPRHPWLLARFAAIGLRSAAAIVERFEDAPARALFGGCAAHACLPLTSAGTASFGLVLAIAAHAADWPCPRGGAVRIAEALAARAAEHGCELRTGTPVRSLRDLPPAGVVLCDLTPVQLDAVAGDLLSPGYRRRLLHYRYGPGVFKVDWALSAPIPWRDPVCGTALTVHLGGTFDDIARAEADVGAGRLPEAPFVILGQQSLFDDTRAPLGQHTAWGYCHVPNGASLDMTAAIERQVERCAPGFRDLILARHTMSPAALALHNPNLVGGDVGGGANDIWQFLMRPFPRLSPYTTSNRRIFMCSSATPPGGGVHGMCGYWAAHEALGKRGWVRA